MYHLLFWGSKAGYSASFHFYPQAAIKTTINANIMKHIDHMDARSFLSHPHSEDLIYYYFVLKSSSLLSPFHSLHS